MSKALEAIHPPPPSRQSLYLALPREVKFARYAKRAHPCLSLFVPNKIRQFFRTSLSHKGSSKVVFSPRAVSDLNLLSLFWFYVLAQIQDVQVVQSLG